MPSHAEDYIHRIGRTGRAGRMGKAIMIATPKDDKLLEAIQKLIGTEIPLTNFPVEIKRTPIQPIKVNPIKSIKVSEPIPKTVQLKPKSIKPATMVKKGYNKELITSDENFDMPSFIKLSFESRKKD